MIADSKHIDRIIARFLAGEATEEEKLLLNRWMDESEVNRKYFGDIQFVNEKAVASHRLVKVDVDKAWNKVHQQMKSKLNEKKEESRIVSFRIPLWLRVAAVVVIVSGISLSLYKYYFIPRIEQRETLAVVSQDSIVSRQLTDSSTVFLNRNSRITYSPSYGKKNRKVKLEGEAYFDVKHIDEKPFIVEAEGTFIEDIGTSFNIKAFAGDTLVEVYVKSGEVKFFTSDKNGVTLIEGETGVFNKKTRKFTTHKATQVNVISYINKVFVFQNTRLSEVVQQLSSIYNVSIIITNNKLSDCTITVTFENEEIDVILSIITETLNLQLVKENESYIISGESCFNP